MLFWIFPRTDSILVIVNDNHVPELPKVAFQFCLFYANVLVFFQVFNMLSVLAFSIKYEYLITVCMVKVMHNIIYYTTSTRYT